MIYSFPTTPNEIVEKLNFQTQRLVGDGPRAGILLRSAVGWGRLGLVQCPEHVDFGDIVCQGEQLPLYIHFPFGANRESVHLYLHTDIRNHRLKNPEPPRIDFLSLFAIDLCLHLIDQVGRLGIHLDGKVSARCIRLAQAARSQRAGGAIGKTG